MKTFHSTPRHLTRPPPTTAMKFVSLVLATLAVSVAAQTDCDLSDPAALGRCLKRLLEQSRDKVRQESDPLHLPNHHDGELTASDIVVRGLAGYSVPELSVTFPQPSQIALRATLAWPGINGDLFVRVKKCKRILWKKRCASASARPHVTVGRTQGTLSTVLTISVDPHGQVSVVPSGTTVSLNLASIHVRANLRGVGGLINKLIGDPASRIATKLAGKWWRNNKGKVETKAKNALEKAVREDLSAKLADVLKM